MSTEVLKFTIYLKPVSKKNHMQIVRHGNYANLIQSKAYREYEAAFIAACDDALKLKIDYPVNVKALYYMPTRRRVDATNLNSALHDCLTKAGIISDDNRDIVAGSDGTRVKYDKLNPRTEVVITKLDEPYEVWKNA